MRNRVSNSCQPRLGLDFLAGLGYHQMRKKSTVKGFLSMIDGFVRIAAITPDLRVADCAGNAAETVRAAQRAAQAGASVAVFPELGLTGYTCGDLFLQDALVRGAQEALSAVLAGTANLDLLLAVGLPVRCGAALYNCAAVLCAGRILGLVPKTHIPNYGE